jgi:hypothetical protein
MPGILMWQYSPVILANILARKFVLVKCELANSQIFLKLSFVAMLILENIL